MPKDIEKHKETQSLNGKGKNSLFLFNLTLLLLLTLHLTKESLCRKKYQCQPIKCCRCMYGDESFSLSFSMCKCEVSQQMKWKQIGSSILLNNLNSLLYNMHSEVSSVAGDCQNPKIRRISELDTQLKQMYSFVFLKISLLFSCV